MKSFQWQIFHGDGNPHSSRTIRAILSRTVTLGCIVLLASLLPACSEEVAEEAPPETATIGVSVGFADDLTGAAGNVQSVWLTVTQVSDGAVLAEEALTQNTTTSAYEGTLTDLPLEVELAFAGAAYDSADRSGIKLFQGSKNLTLTGSEDTIALDLNGITVSIDISVSLNDATPQLVSPFATAADVQSVWITVTNTVTTLEEINQALVNPPGTNLYEGTLAGLSVGASLTFLAEAYDTLDRLGTLIFDGSKNQTLTGADDRVTLALDPVGGGTPFVLPSVREIAGLDNPVLPGSVTPVTFTIAGNQDETLNWTLAEVTAGGGSFDIASGTKITSTLETDPVSGDPVYTGQFTSTFTAASGVDGRYDYEITLTNSTSDTVTQQFAIFVTAFTPGAGGLNVILSPVVQSISGQRTKEHDILFQAAVADETLEAQLRYQWSFIGGLSFVDAFVNPTTMLNYDPNVSGTIDLIVEDSDGGITTVSLTLVKNQFPDSVAPLGLYAAKSIDGGSAFTCARLAWDKVACWGGGLGGQLGNGGNQNQLSPTLASIIDDARSAPALGEDHACILVSTGIKCWGDKYMGALGDGSGNSAFTPVSVSGISNALAVDAGGTHTCAVVLSGDVKCWGANWSGQLGTGDTTAATTPVLVLSLGSVAAVGVVGGQLHSCALLEDFTVKCWGENSKGQLGDGNLPNDSLIPVAVTGIDGSTAALQATALASYWDHTCALMTNGTVKCWGAGGSGRLGSGTVNSGIPVDVTGISTATAIATGFEHTCALLADGTVQCWGENFYGPLGNGDQNVEGAVPGPVCATGATPPCSVGNNNILTGVTSIGAGNRHTCAVLTNGAMRCWGDNGGRLGDGTLVRAWVPVRVDEL